MEKAQIRIKFSKGSVSNGVGIRDIHFNIGPGKKSRGHSFNVVVVVVVLI